MENNEALFNRILIVTTGLMLILVLIAMLTVGAGRGSGEQDPATSALPAIATTEATTTPTPGLRTGAYISVPDSATAIFDTERLDAGYALLVNLGTGRDVASYNADARIYPASMTKVMTLLVACEAIDDVSVAVHVNASVLAAAYEAGASCAGFFAGERVTVLDLLYGAALPSGADATGTLAVYVAGSEAAFVRRMNEKAAELGLTRTHFVNSSGLHDADHYTTPREMAAIMACAMDNELCRTLLAARTYTTSVTDEHPEGLTLYSTAFSRMVTTEFGAARLIAAKTGYTDEARFCLVSYAETATGRYVLVTAGGTDRYAPVYDCKYVYGEFAE